ncbi:MAG: hypothetical protein E7041_07420 [Lentisphaerae bacterium]|nr:hypothetical protein [Lentisphaerota bacterium]
MIFSKKNTRFSIMGMLAAVFTVGCLLTGCGDSASDSGDVKYLLYKKEGDAKQGYYIHVIGLNTECDQGGTLKVNLDDIINKNQGKITIPAEIDGLPVKKITFAPKKQDLLGGIVADTGSLSLRTITDSDGMKFYLEDTSKYYGYVSELVLPDGVEEVDLREPGWFDPALQLSNLNVPASVTKIKTDHIKGKLVISEKAYRGGFFGSSDVSADHLEVFATDNAPITEDVEVCATKTAKFPENIKKLNLHNLFNMAHNIKHKGLEVTCAPDVTVIVSKDPAAAHCIRSSLQYGDVKINGKDLKDILK